MKKYFLVFFLVIFPFAVFSESLDPIAEQIKLYRKQGDDLLSSGNIVAALSFFQKTIQIDPYCYECYNDLGTLYEELGDYDKAVGMYKTSIFLNSEYSYPYMNLALLYEIIGEKSSALSYWGKIYFSFGGDHILFKKSKRNILRLLRVSQIEQKELLAIVSRKAERVKKMRDGILTVSREQAIEYRELAQKLKSIGDLNEAINLYKKATQVNPYFYEAYNDLGVIYESLGNRDKAIKAYKKAIEINPSYLPPYANLALIYEETRSIDKSFLFWKRRFILANDRNHWTDQALKRLIKLQTIYPDKNSLFQE